ncbi:MAG: NADH-quinone oxidoreductase subunit C [Clostridiales Family XIII bacterium]|jgi:ech hydrogenase subunit D|nr:NADH-quinone oxidoreductase subunit C [Clostridiales Family XIII bacterium]
MSETQKVRDLSSVAELTLVVTEKKSEGWRLCQMHAAYSDRLFLIYSFVRDQEMENLRIYPEEGVPVESITGIYPYAFLYENEIKELFGVQIANISLDFQGTFYKIAKPTPFAKAPEEADEIAPEKPKRPMKTAPKKEERS